MIHLGRSLNSIISRTTHLTTPNLRYSVRRDFSLFSSLFKFFWQKPSNGVKITYLSEKELEKLCEENFNRKLQELAKKLPQNKEAPSSNQSPLKPK